VFSNPSLLQNISDAPPVVITGVNKGTAAVTTNKAGVLPGLEKVLIYFSPQIKRNILRFSAVHQHYPIEWDPDTSEFSFKDDIGEVHKFEENHHVFSKLFPPPSSSLILHTTVADIKSQYSKQEVARADLSREIARRLGFESDSGLARVIRDSSIHNLPINLKDVTTAQHIYGPNIASLKGKSTEKKSINAPENRVNRHEEKLQALILDIMYVNSEPYLITVSDPLNLTTVDHLPTYSPSKSKSSKVLEKSLGDQLRQYKGEGFHVHSVTCDNESALVSLKSVINSLGAKLSTTGVNSHSVAIVDRKIRFIKERIRSIIHGLPFPLPPSLMKYCVYFATSRINLIRHSETSDKISPLELFTGRRTDFKIDLRVAFGDYVQVHTPHSSNNMDPRSTGCIALLPTGNKNGSVLFYSLATGKVITRDHWTPLPTPEEVVQQMKLIHDKEIKRRSPTSTSESSTPLPAHQPPSLPILNSIEHEYNAVRNIPDIPPDVPPHQTATVEETSPLDLPSPTPPPPPLPDPSPVVHSKSDVRADTS
jgi:hypothetical protein